MKSLLDIYPKYCGSEDAYRSLGREAYNNLLSTAEGRSTVKITSGTDKGTSHDYIPIYEKYITKRNNIDFLEIGIAEGYSMKMWNDYFENSRIYGCDHNLGQMHFKVDNVFEIDSSNPDSVASVFANKKFNYIIDDGDHKATTQIKTFDCMWPYLKDEGIYFIEDIENDNSLSMIINHIGSLRHHVYDNRQGTGQWDEIMIIIFKDIEG